VNRSTIQERLECFILYFFFSVVRLYRAGEESVTVCENKQKENSIEKEKEDDSRHLYCCVLYARRTFFLKSGSLFLQKINVLNWTTGNGITHQVGSSIYKPCCVYCIYTVHKESCRIKSKRKRSAHLRGPTNITFGWEDFLTKGHIHVPYIAYIAIHSYTLESVKFCTIRSTSHYTDQLHEK
jgi:hypothetical protein